MSKDTLNNGEVIQKFGSLVSKNGKVSLQLQDDGSKAIWSSNTGEDSFIIKGVMQPDGNFVLYDHNGGAR